MTVSIDLTDFPKLEVFTCLFQLIKQICENVNISFTEEQMYIQTMDSSKISILEVTIPRTWFHSYTCSTPTTIGVNSTILHKMLNSRDKTQLLNIQHQQNADVLLLSMTSEYKTVFDKNFEVPLMDIDQEIMNIPDMEYQTEIGMPTITFSTLVSQLKNFGDSLEILCNEEKIELLSKSSDLGKMSVQVKIDDLSSYSIDENCEMNMTFSASHLHTISSNNKIAREVEIKLKENSPLRVDYKDGELTVRYYLAPKINDNE